jgi:iron complex outermembrane receptor protein
MESDFFLQGDIDGGSQDFFQEFRTIPRESTTQEFRLQSNDDSRLQWNVGFYYSDDEGFIDNKTFVGARVFLAFPEGFLIDSEETFSSSEVYAVFGQVNYAVSNGLTLTVGGRYSEEEIFHGPFRLRGRDFPGADGLRGHLYRLLAHGVPALRHERRCVGLRNDRQGLQVRWCAGGAARSHDHQPTTRRNFGTTSWVYKGSFSTGHLRLNLAAFYMDWTDQQTSQQFSGVDGDGKFFIFGAIDNADSAESYGVELSVNAAPVDGLLINLNVGWLQAEYQNFTTLLNPENRALSICPGSPSPTRRSGPYLPMPSTASR